MITYTALYIYRDVIVLTDETRHEYNQQKDN